MISSISAYFMQAYGVIIDKGMLLKPCIYVALVKISYGGFKSALRSRVKIALSTLASAAIIFTLMSKIFIPFFREHNASTIIVLLPYYPIYSGIRLAKSLAQKPLPFTYVAGDATLTNDKARKF